MLRVVSLQNTIHIMSAAIRCPRCQGQQIIKQDDADNDFLSAKAYCTCPGGPAWEQLTESELGQSLMLVNGQEENKNKDFVAIWDNSTNEYVLVACGAFRQAVITIEETNKGLLHGA